YFVPGSPQIRITSPQTPQSTGSAKQTQQDRWSRRAAARQDIEPVTPSKRRRLHPPDDDDQKEVVIQLLEDDPSAWPESPSPKHDVDEPEDGDCKIEADGQSTATAMSQHETPTPAPTLAPDQRPRRTRRVPNSLCTDSM